MKKKNITLVVFGLLLIIGSFVAYISLEKTSDSVTVESVATTELTLDKSSKKTDISSAKNLILAQQGVSSVVFDTDRNLFKVTYNPNQLTVVDLMNNLKQQNVNLIVPNSPGKLKVIDYNIQFN